MWLVRPPFEDPIRLEGNEDVARQLSKERGMTHIWIRLVPMIPFFFLMGAFMVVNAN